MIIFEQKCFNQGPLCLPSPETVSPSSAADSPKYPDTTLRDAAGCMSRGPLPDQIRFLIGMIDLIYNEQQVPSKVLKKSIGPL
ncbi:hypothetical protein HNY73_012870 [Argiope bruennichi]|uniref:Uncharacterized protein n=1 Tax=Argiope bruennichi TaxID=94029 RepID=A0A8T0EW95_ARGBR|nr:hypothetical protein HNY73_012870 [Argiope bruennichi]